MVMTMLLEKAGKGAHTSGSSGKNGQIFDGLPASFIIGEYEVDLWVICLAAALAVLIVAALVLIHRRKDRPGEMTRMAVPSAVPFRDMEEERIGGGPQILTAVHQHIGAREDQQDSFGVSDPNVYVRNGLMAVVADGMGGLANGRAVSSALVSTFQEGFQYARPGMDRADLLLELAIRANAGVNQMLRGAERSGSTLVAASVCEGMLHFLTVGDSRIYLYRGGALLQLNREHIYQEELAAKALNQLVSIQQVRGDRQAHSLTSYFGIGRIPLMDRNYEGIRLVNGDKILLASDGVFGTLSQAQMEAALERDVTEAAKVLGDWIRTANRPHQDNNTAVVLEYRA